jgi:hypothetical protein
MANSSKKLESGLAQVISFWSVFAAFAAYSLSMPNLHCGPFAVAIVIAWWLCSDDAERKTSPLYLAGLKTPSLRAFYEGVPLKNPQSRTCLILLWPGLCFVIVLVLGFMGQVLFALWLSTGSTWSIENLPRPAWQHDWGSKAVPGLALFIAGLLWKSWLISVEAPPSKDYHEKSESAK